MSQKSFLDQIHYTQLISVTVVEDRIGRNFELIVKEMQLRSQEDQRRDAQMQEIRDTLDRLLQRQRQKEQRQQGKGHNGTTTPSVTKNFHIINNIKGNLERGQGGGEGHNSSRQRAEREKVNREVTDREENPQIEGESKQLRTPEGNAYSDVRVEQFLKGMQERVLKAENEIVATKLNNSSMEKQISQLRHELQSHTNNDNIHVPNYRDILKDLASITQIDKRVNYVSEMCRENEALIHTKVSELSNRVNETMGVLKERVEGVEQHLGIHDQTIEQLKLRIIERRPVIEKTNPQLVAKTSQQVDLEEKVAYLMESNNHTTSTIKQILDQLKELNDINNNQLKDSNDLHPHQETLPTHSTDSDRNKKLQNLSLKVGDMRREYLSLIKNLRDELQSHVSKLPDMSRVTDLISQLRMMIGKKADDDSLKKMYGYLQNKLQIILKEIFKEDDDDARIGKTNWHCLSCDRGLKHFKGRVGEHLATETMKGKKLERGDPTSGRLQNKTNMELPGIYRNTEPVRKV